MRNKAEKDTRKKKETESKEETESSRKFEKKKESQSLLKVENLSLSFSQYASGLRQTELKVISNLSIEAHTGEILAVVGSSGAGKSLLAHAILGILPSNSKLEGKIQYKGQELTQERKEDLRGKEIALIPQSVTYLDPLLRISKQVIGACEEKEKDKKTELQKRIFQRYNLKPEVNRMFPHELSGGMTRRVLVSTAVISSAKLVIADEPTPGLDEKTLDETLNYLREIADKGCAVILITHDIEAALKISDKIAVFYAGTILEVANVEDFRDNGENLRHPYTQALWNALPQNKFQAIRGHQPVQDEVVDGCIFYQRCLKKNSLCLKGIPQLRRINGGVVRCNNAS